MDANGLRSNITRARIVGALAGVCCGALGVAHASVASFQVIAPAQGFTQTQAFAVSPDGAVVAGDSFGVGGVAFTFTRAGGRSDIRRWDYSGVVGVAADTRTLAINTWSLEEGGRAVRWDGDDSAQVLAAPAGFSETHAAAISRDANVIVGAASARGGFGTTWQAFRWAADGINVQAEVIGPAGSRARAVSADGRVVVGDSDQGAWLWREGVGFLVLPGPGAPFNVPEVKGLTADGRFAVGRVELTAVRWNPDLSFTVLDDDPFGDSEAFGVTDDGATVVGRRANTGFVWTAQHGMRTVAEVLQAHGVTMPEGFHVWEARCVSADGSTITGMGTFDGLNARAFVVTLPTPAGAVLLLLAFPAAARRRR